MSFIPETRFQQLIKVLFTFLAIRGKSASGRPNRGGWRSQSGQEAIGPIGHQIGHVARLGPYLYGVIRTMSDYFSSEIDNYLAAWILPDTWHKGHATDEQRFFMFVKALHHYDYAKRLDEPALREKLSQQWNAITSSTKKRLKT